MGGGELDAAQGLGAGVSFDRDAAVRDWRVSILSRGGLTVSEVDELEDHLELVEADLSEGMRPSEAFWVAAHRVGTPDALTREFAKVRPNMGWEVRAQWALLGLLAYMLLLPLAQLLLYSLIAGLSRLPGFVGPAAGLRLNMGPLSLLLVVVGVVFMVRGSGASPAVVERALGRFTALGWPGLAVAVGGMVAWQLGLGVLTGRAFSLVRATLERPGELAPIQSEVWFWLANALRLVVPALLVGLIVWVQRRLQRARPGEM